MGDHCEQRNDSCRYVQCENGGKCFTRDDEPICECLGKDLYHGDRCQYRRTRLIVLQSVSKTFSWLSILILSSFALFIIMMDCLKYCFHIDLTENELNEIRRETVKKKKKHRPVIQKFVYVNPPLETIDEE